jgi:threonyl-tRNA synthetase
LGNACTVEQQQVGRVCRQHEEKRNSYTILVGKSEVKEQFQNLSAHERSVPRNSKEMSLEGVEWIHLAPLLDQWRVIVNMVIKLGKLSATPKWIFSIK